MILAKRHGLRERERGLLPGARGHTNQRPDEDERVDLNGDQLRKGAGEAIIAHVKERGGQVPPALDRELGRITGEGGTPLAVAGNGTVVTFVSVTRRPS